MCLFSSIPVFLLSLSVSVLDSWIMKVAVGQKPARFPPRPHRDVQTLLIWAELSSIARSVLLLGGSRVSGEGCPSCQQMCEFTLLFQRKSSSSEVSVRGGRVVWWNLRKSGNTFVPETANTQTCTHTDVHTPTHTHAHTGWTCVCLMVPSPTSLSHFFFGEDSVGALEELVTTATCLHLLQASRFKIKQFWSFYIQTIQSMEMTQSAHCHEEALGCLNPLDDLGSDLNIFSVNPEEVLVLVYLECSESRSRAAALTFWVSVSLFWNLWVRIPGSDGVMRLTDLLCLSCCFRSSEFCLSSKRTLISKNKADYFRL